MQHFEYIFFDLDGTIFNSEAGISRSVKYALSKFGIDENDENKLKAFIGPPLKDSFMKYYGFSEQQARDAIKFYREYYSDKGIFEGHIYNNVEKILAYINERGKKAVLATSKPKFFAEQIIEHLGLTKYFDFISGATLDETVTGKYEVIKIAIDEEKIDDLSSILMVGDRLHDVEGAKKAGIKCVGVLYGFGSESELREAGADHIISDAFELADII